MGDKYEHTLFQVVSWLRIRLELLEQAGISYVPKEEYLTQKSTVMKVNNLEELRNYIGDCTKCKLCTGRASIVFGSGSNQAKIVFVGEGPGADEDLQGEPFVGRAGKLLSKIIIAMGLTRDRVYICNVVKCRPPQNRNPEEDEIAACEPFLQKQLEIIAPRIIIGLGRYACQTLLKTKIPMSKIRGQWHEYQGIKFMPTFHPAYLLRNPAAKKEVWHDMQLVMKASES